MKVYYRPTPKLTIELEVADQKALVEELAKVQEIVVHVCGKCGAGTESIIYNVREVDENRFYEIRCTKCHAGLSFGAHKKGNSLFPRRYTEDEEGKREWLPHNGWVHWDAAQKKLV